MWIAELWRYPVKSMAGERLERAELGANGIAGDRVVLVRDARGHIVTARARPRLLGHRAVIGPGREPLVDGRPWDAPEVAGDVEAAAGVGSRLVRADGPGRFDVAPLLVATDGAIAAFGYDGRRLRPNLVVGGAAGLAERAWEGRLLRAGATIIALHDLRQRCIMTTFDPDTLEQDNEILLSIHRRFGGSLALNASVVSVGELAVGDPIELVEPGDPAQR